LEGVCILSTSAVAHNTFATIWLPFFSLAGVALSQR
jgi:hypothetical protein